MKIILVLLGCFLLGCYGTPVGSAGATGPKPSGPLGQVSGLLDIIKRLGTSSSSTMTLMPESSGFSFMDNQVEFSQGEILAVDLPELVKLWFYNGMPQEQVDFIANSMKVYALQLPGSGYTDNKYGTHFNNGNGLIFMNQFNLIPHETVPGAIRWQKISMTSKFKPSPRQVFVTETDCDIWSCDSYTRIMSLEPKIEDGHLSMILNMNFRLLSEFVKYQPQIGQDKKNELGTS